MAKNDVVLIDSLLRNRSATVGTSDQGELFELFVIEQVLKNHDLSREEIDIGWIDGTHDGGIDAFYTFINGRLLVDPTDFAWPKSGAEIQVFLLTCKHHNTFLQAPLDALLASVQEIFDLSKPTSALVGKYSPALRKCRDAFVAAYDQLSLYRPIVTFRVVYASRGDTALLGESVAARGAQIKELLESYFSASSATFSPLGATELIDLHREVKSFSLDLPVQECLTAGQEGYVVLSRLTDYCQFVRDDKGELRRYLFDSNVRAFLGVNLVNKDIADTLKDPAAPNFWWLNNGVTILATSASLVGKTLKLKDIQIVNGLQTTESIHKNFPAKIGGTADSRSLLVKVIVSADERIRDQVIRATNNQTSVEPSALHATDRIQQDIEEILLRHDWYYERRTNYFRNEGRPDNRILSPLLLATGSVALLLKNPVAASKLKQKHIRSSQAYGLVYSSRFPLEAWPMVAALVRGAEGAITRSNQGKRGSRTRHLSTWRGVLAYVASVRLTGTFGYALRDLCGLSQAAVTEVFMDDCWATLAKAAGGLGNAKVSEAKMQHIAMTMASTWGVTGNLSDGRVRLPQPPTAQSRASAPVAETEEFLTAVSKVLPPQPWKPGVHRLVAATLKASPARVSRAIQALIARKEWLQQKDGVVYDESGMEVMRDHTRAPLVSSGDLGNKEI